MNLADTFNLAAHNDLDALDHECARANDLDAIAARELLATVRARHTKAAEHQHVRNEIVAKHLRARGRRAA